jgi:putative oxidoreductase
MDNIRAKLNQYQPQILSIFRIMFGLLILQAGCSKLFGFPAAQPANFQVIGMLGVAGFIECIGGALVTVGLFTRYAALIVSGEMAVAYFIYANRLALFPWSGPSGANRSSFIPAVNGGNLEVAFCFAFLLLVFFGAGIWSLDAKLRNRT